MRGGFSPVRHSWTEVGYMRGIGCYATQAPSILQRENTGHPRPLFWRDPHNTFSSRYPDWCCLAWTVHIHVQERVE